MRFLIVMAIVLLAAPAGAQPKTAEEPVPTLAPVVVPGTPFIVPDRTATTEEARQEIQRTVPGGAEVIGEGTIKDSLATNLRGVLDFVPGVLVRPRFGLADESQFSIRGSGLQNNFHNRDVNFLFNGYLYGQADGFSDFESIELMDTKRIEVFKGANALRYGANSIGGGVNFVTKTGYDAGPIEYWGEAGSFGFFKQHIATGWVRGPFDLYGGFSAVGLEGYRAHAEQQRYRLNTSTGWNFGGGMTARFDVGWVRSLENLPGALTRGQFEANPRQRNPSTAFANEQRNYDYPNGAFTFRLPLAPNQELVSLTQLNYQDLNIRCPSPSSTRPRTTGARSSATSTRPPSRTTGISSPPASSTSAHSRTTHSSRTWAMRWPARSSSIRSTTPTTTASTGKTSSTSRPPSPS